MHLPFKPSPKLYEALYVSTLHTDYPVRVVADIAVAARLRNAALGITGILIFDGLHFCQQIEGSPKAVLMLLEKITSDARHENVQVLHHQRLEQRRFNHFSLGYALIDNASEALAHLEKLEGPAAIEAFERLLPALDMGSVGSVGSVGGKASVDSDGQSLPKQQCLPG